MANVERTSLHFLVDQTLAEFARKLVRHLAGAEKAKGVRQVLANTIRLANAQVVGDRAEFPNHKRMQELAEELVRNLMVISENLENINQWGVDAPNSMHYADVNGVVSQAKDIVNAYGLSWGVKRRGVQLTVDAPERLGLLDGSSSQNGSPKYAGLASSVSFAVDRVARRLHQESPADRAKARIADLDNLLGSIVQIWNDRNEKQRVEFAKIYVRRDSASAATVRAASEFQRPENDVQTAFSTTDDHWDTRLEENPGDSPPVFVLVNTLGERTHRLEIRVTPNLSEDSDIVENDRDAVMPCAHLRNAIAVKENSEAPDLRVRTPTQSREDLNIFATLLRGSDVRQVTAISKIGMGDLEEVLRDQINDGMLSTTIDVLKDLRLDEMFVTVLAIPDGPRNRTIGMLMSEQPLEKRSVDYFSSILPMVTHVVDSADHDPMGDDETPT